MTLSATAKDSTYFTGKKIHITTSKKTNSNIMVYSTLWWPNNFNPFPPKNKPSKLSLRRRLVKGLR